MSAEQTFTKMTFMNRHISERREIFTCIAIKPLHVCINYNKQVLK